MRGVACVRGDGAALAKLVNVNAVWTRDHLQQIRPIGELALCYLFTLNQTLLFNLSSCVDGREMLKHLCNKIKVNYTFGHRLTVSIID